MLYKSNSVRETANIASAFAKTLNPGDVVCLWGDLGVGKTAFAAGLSKGLGVTEYVQSPTFTVVNCYNGKIPVYHFDVYRIADPEEMYEIGYEEYVYGDGVSIIEWPQLIQEILPENRHDVTILKNLDVHTDFREITIEKRGKE